MLEQEQQDLFLEKVGRRKAEELQRIWNNCYPRFCSIPYGESLPKNHTKEEVFREECRQKGFKESEVEMFLSL